MCKKVYYLFLIPVMILFLCSCNQEIVQAPVQEETSGDFQGTIYTISFDANGGYGTMIPIYAKEGQNITLNMNTYARLSHKFLGWSTVKTSNVVEYADGAKIYNITKDMTLYAVWEVYNKTISITFNANGGRGWMGSIYASYGAEDVQLAINNYTREGYYFAGWSTDMNAEEPDYIDGYIINKVISDLSLYAVWKEADGTGQDVYVYFNSSGGVGEMEPVKLKTSSIYTLPPCNFTKSGYTFAGWSKSASAMLVDYENQEVINGFPTSIILYAVWVKN